MEDNRKDLSDRQKLILKAIIEEYVDSNTPVGSKVLTERPYLKFSSATLRYDMQKLEDDGYLEKTHTSSGRIPSQVGYRYYVDKLFSRDIDESDFLEFDKIFDNPKLTKEEAIKQIIDLLANKTGYYSMILGSSANFAKIKKMEIVPINADEAVLLIVTSVGIVQSQKIAIPEGYKMDDLLRIIEMFDNAMYDQSVAEIREILSKEASKPRIRQMVDFRDDILNFMIKGFARFSNTESYSAGLSKVFLQPEFQNHTIMQKILKVIDDESIEGLVGKQEKILSVRIGHENSHHGLEDCSIVTVRYFIDDDEYGSIAVVGPCRMQYKKVIPLLEYIAKSMPKLYSR